MAVMVLLVAGGVVRGPAAGEKTYSKCPLDTQTCLNRMVAKLKNRGWLGIEYGEIGTSEALRLLKVVAGSPAESAGFRVGDVLVSLEGAKYADSTEDKCVPCDFMKENWIPGRKVRFVVNRSGKEIRLTPTLAPLPSDVMAVMVGMHMIEHATAPPPSK
jgi:C-terminal processing protease CtpA/Prc